MQHSRSTGGLGSPCLKSCESAVSMSSVVIRQHAACGQVHWHDDWETILSVLCVGGGAPFFYLFF